MLESYEQKMLMLETVNEVSTVAVTEATFYSIAGHNTNFIADYHNPFDAANLDYTFTTITEEVTKAALKPNTLFTAFNGKVFRIKNILPDAMGWLVISASWEDSNVYP